MNRVHARSLASIAALATALAASQAGAQERSRYVSPYIELGQVVAADLSNDDVTTYSQVAVGVDAGISSVRADAQISYRYERRIGWDDEIGDDDIHSGLARASVRVTPTLTLDAGALATRTRSDIRGAAPGVFAGDVANVAQVYSLYAGPSLATSVGPVSLGASYLLGYTKVEVPNAVDLGPGQRRRDYFDDSVSHLAQVSAGIAPGAVLPVGITLSGAYEREDAGQLDQQYEGYYGRGDVLLPVSATLAVRGGIGYEKIETSQKDALLDTAGDPVLDGNGRFVTDPNSPQRIAYNTDGLIYDAGVVWRPNPRLELQANAGWRYGGEIYTGALSYRMSRDVAVQVVVYDGIETFGRQLRDGLRDLPTSFQTQPDPFGQQFAGCVFGSKPGGTGGGGQGAGAQSAGGCLNDAFQSISTSSYRARGIDGVISVTRGLNSFGVGAGYANRKLYTPRTAPGITVFGSTDESYYAQGFYSRALSRVSSFDANLFANYYEGGVSGTGIDPVGVFGAGATGSYSHSFGRLGTIASLGVYTYDQDGFDANWSAQALLGARYQF